MATEIAPEVAAQTSSGPPPPPPAPNLAWVRFVALFRLFLQMQLTRARVIGLSAAGLVGIGVALLLRSSSRTNAVVGPQFVSLFGLELFVPVCALLLATATLGDMNDDGTLVYVWMRPVPRWHIVAAAFGSSFTAALPLTLIPLLIAAAITGGGPDLAIAVVVAVPLSLLAYTAAFGALGLRSRRSVIWGLLYIFIIEGFVARGGTSLAHLAIRCYTESVVSSITQVPLDQAVIEPPVSWIVPLVVAALAVAYAIRRLHVQDVA